MPVKIWKNIVLILSRLVMGLFLSLPLIFQDEVTGRNRKKENICHR